MGDIADLKARIHAARQFTVTVGPADAPRTIQLQEPDEHQVKLCAIRAGQLGIDTVIVNGQVTVSGGAYTDARSGLIV
jgi:hypothetical protein